jgi:tRNA U54 and U55 pseudouridine synthase Pus10
MFGKYAGTIPQMKKQTMKGQCMKTESVKTLVRFSGLLIALALFGGITTGVKAQEKGGAIQLRLSDRSAATANTSAVHSSMSCPKCQDIFVTQRDTSAKGGQILMTHGNPTVKVAKHLCDGCKLDWTVVREAGAKPQAVANHKCASCVAKTVASGASR